MEHTAEQRRGGAESYTYAPGFKLTSIATTSGTESYGYDGGGRLTSIDRGGVHRELGYSSDDKLTVASDDGQESLQAVYDGAGRRIYSRVR